MGTKNPILSTTQNILGLTMPTIYIGGVPYQLPIADRGNRKENFIKEIKTWTDLDRVLHERVKGYRLFAEYTWDHLLPDEMNSLLDIYNAAEQSIDVKLKFASFPRRYSVQITTFDHDLSEGYGFQDSATMEFTGINLLKSFPNPDEFYTMLPMLGRGCIVRTLNEQNL